MPWIDPQKEATAEEKMVQSGFKSRSQVIRERGGNPQDIFEQIKQEREKEKEAEISFSTSQDSSNQGSKDNNQDSENIKNKESDEEPKK